MKKIKDIKLSNDPCVALRAVLFDDDNDTVQDKNKKQFITTKSAMLNVIFDDNTSLYLYAPEGYKFDGATIPFGIGKGDMKLVIPALFHDITCENKQVVDYDRKLASTIFKEALIKCKVNKILAEDMYLHVELYQKLFSKWRKP